MICSFLAILPAVVFAAAVDGSKARSQLPWSSEGVGGAVPQYVIDYAPLIYLHSEEIYLPADISTQLAQTHATENAISLAAASSPMTLDLLDSLNDISESEGEDVFLTSKGDYAKDADWLHGVLPNAHGKTENATSCAVLINHKGKGVVDAFYMYFFAYNQGGKVLGWRRFGNHLGDWEHTMVRFKNGKPTEAWYSQHGGGTAYKFSALEKRGKRPIGYSGNGTHATWATVGTHDHTIPGVISTFGPLLDHTNKGHLWDPLLNAAFYTVYYESSPPDTTEPTFTALQNPFAISANASNEEEQNSRGPAPHLTPNWLYFNGHWGNSRLPASHPLQSDLLNFGLVFKYVGAPNGPRFKQLNRVDVCERHFFMMWCFVRRRLFPGS